MASSAAEAAYVLQHAKQVAALTGAGISTPSGIPDFRSPTSGMWASTDPMIVASLAAFEHDPQPFYHWIAPLLRAMLQARPNPAHVALAELEQCGKLQAVITQNIDGLHQAARSRTVFELHGHIRTSTCIRCGQQVLTTDQHLQLAQQGAVPRCDCGGALKPDVVLFGEDLPYRVWQDAVKQIERCDTLLIAGTGLEVYPVGGLPELALEHGARLIIVNYAPTWADGLAEVSIQADVADVLPEIVRYFD